MTKWIRVILLLALALAAPAIMLYSSFFRHKLQSNTEQHTNVPELQQPSPSPMQTSYATPTAEASNFSTNKSPGQDPVATLAAILEAHKRGDTHEIEKWATPEAAVQLQSFPPGAFDPRVAQCIPAPDQQSSTDLVCTLKPKTFMLGEIEARMRQTGEGYQLIRVNPVVD